MADCPSGNERLFGGAVVLEVADGCPDTLPAESEWKALGAGTSKGWDASPNTVTSDADDGGGFVESITTNSDFTISFEGEVRKRDKLDQYGIGRFIQYFFNELAAKRQPGIWVRLEYGPVTFVGYMVITALSSDGGTNDIVTFSTEFKVGASETIQVTLNDPTPVTGVTVTPTSGTVAEGSTVNFTVNVAPADATNKSFSVTSSDGAVATATKTGPIVTVTGASEGTANITVTTTDGSFNAVYAVTVTA